MISVRILCFVIALVVRAALGSSNWNFDHDPYLQYQPHFSHSLPVQLVITAIVLTLCTILLVQLLFTWPYHWSIARVNWMLQFTSVCTLLLNVVSITYVVLSELGAKSRQWPYMFEYIAIRVPLHQEWSVAQRVVWHIMEATTSALVSITHIQFLTYLYPSRLEARLVFFLLGPLAVVAGAMTLLPAFSHIHILVANIPSINSTNPFVVTATTNHTAAGLDYYDAKELQFIDLVDAARNICNLTLSLLFTISLLIWGFFVNRRSAWRTDGGTAAFGVGALFLALVGTGLNFLNVFVHPRFSWLSSLLWSVVLWQGFFGWWWWVGSASGIAARESDLDDRGRKEEKHTKRKRRKTAMLADDDGVRASSTGKLDRWRSSVGATLSRRRHVPMAASNEAVEPPVTHTDVTGPTPAENPPAPSRLSWISSTRIFATLWHAWSSLRQAHVRAARAQAIEQRQIQIQMELENGRSLGHFSGGFGAEREDGVQGESTLSDGDADVQAPDQDEAGGRSRKTLWWWGPLRNWRLRDSTVY